jgi:hypothetical protein
VTTLDKLLNYVNAFLNGLKSYVTQFTDKIDEIVKGIVG